MPNGVPGNPTIMVFLLHIFTVVHGLLILGFNLVIGNIYVGEKVDVHFNIALRIVLVRVRRPERANI